MNFVCIFHFSTHHQMVEYYDAERGAQVNFIRCDDKGDTTFLKVQVFTSTRCLGACCEQTPPADAVRAIKIGKSITFY